MNHVKLYNNKISCHLNWQSTFQMIKETNCWPYSFLASDDFPSSDYRGTMRGRLLVYDRYNNKDYLVSFHFPPYLHGLMNLIARYITEFNVPAALAFVGLAAPGDAGSWQRESKVWLSTLVIVSYIRCLKDLIS